MTYIPWILSANVVLMMWLVGNKNPLAWWIGIASQALWLYFDWRVEAWGLMPLAVVLTVVYFRNWQKWRTQPVRATACGSTSLVCDRATGCAADCAAWGT